MKKVVFVTEKLIMGGVEKSLLEWIKILSPYMDIVVAVMHRGGELESEISKFASIHNLSDDRLSFHQSIVNKIKRGKISDAFRMVKAVSSAKKEKSYIRQCVNRIYELEKIEEEFDYSVCFHKPTDILVPYTAMRINAKKKIIWFHTEVSATVQMDKKCYKELYQRYDSFVCVSEAVHAQLEDFLGNRKKDIYTIYNYFDINKMYKKSESTLTEFRNSGIKIVTVGRLSKEKGQDIAIKTARFLKDKNADFTWYFIGDGPYYTELINLTRQYALEKQIMFLGQKENPYPYIRNCDIYVQPSREEGYGMTVAEAKLFQRPIVVTDFLTATEHIKNGENGYIVPMNENELGSKILRLIEEPENRERFSRALAGFEYPIECKKKVFELFGIKQLGEV